MIVVTGATGNVGRTLVRVLVGSGEQVTAVSRSPVAGDVRHVRADLLEPEGLKPAVDGASSLFLLTPGGWTAAGGDGSVLREVLEVARAGGVRRVVLLSSQGVGTSRHSPELEDAVTSSGLEWTVLRPGGFASNALAWAGPVRADRVVAAPFGDVGLPVVDPDDIAGVAAVALREPGHDGRTYVLTGPAPVSPRQQAAALAEALGEPVRFVEQTRAEARAWMVRTMPEVFADATLSILGEPSPAEQEVSPDVPLILDRPARTFAEWARSNVDAFR